MTCATSLRSSMARPHRAMCVALLFLLLGQVSGLAAQAIDCVVPDREGDLRNCTFTEAWARCIEEAEDSFFQCVDGADGFEKLACGLILAVDDIACHLASPFELIRDQ